MERILNTICLFGWTYVMFNTGIKLYLSPLQYLTSNLSQQVKILRIVQTTQILDILLIILGKSKGSLLASFFQTLGRLIIIWFYTQYQINNKVFVIISIAWSIAQVNRYLYYLFNNNKLICLLRYNLFLILYPLGTYGQLCVVNDYIKRNAQVISNELINFSRLVQISIIVGVTCIYIYLLKSRSKNMKKIFEVESTKDSSQTLIKDQRSIRYKSPKGKRQ